MKSLLKIYGKYMATALVILFLLFVLNACVFLYISASVISPQKKGLLTVHNGVDQISGELRYVPSASEEGGAAPLQQEEGSVASPQEQGSVASPQEQGSVASSQEEGSVASPQEQGSVASPQEEGSVASPQEQGSVASPQEEGSVFLSEKGLHMLEKNGYRFAMVLSSKGDVIYNWQLPEELPRSYSLSEVAAFSRWYLKDYPVKIWRSGEKLLVCGMPKDSLWKFSVEFPSKFTSRVPAYLFYGFLCNVFLVLLIILVIGYRFYRSLSPMARGIEALAGQKPVSLPEKGIISDLNAKLNRTSQVLQEQKELIDKRDSARTDWISGVSHDIRTPLSMIMGYADTLSSDTTLAAEQKEQARIIREQSLFIKALIEDLNLTSRLEYHMQPLRLEVFAPAPFLRELVASCLNQELFHAESCENHELSLAISEDLEGVLLSADRRLLLRAVRNLIHNSIRHNPEGCHIRIAADRISESACLLTVADDGKGLPEPIVSTLNGQNLPSDQQPHIMGLRIVKQIVLSHGGTFHISADRHSVLLELPLFKKGR